MPPVWDQTTPEQRLARMNGVPVQNYTGILGIEYQWLDVRGNRAKIAQRPVTAAYTQAIKTRDLAQADEQLARLEQEHAAMVSLRNQGAGTLFPAAPVAAARTSSLRRANRR